MIGNMPFLLTLHVFSWNLVRECVFCVSYRYYIWILPHFGCDSLVFITYWCVIKTPYTIINVLFKHDFRSIVQRTAGRLFKNAFNVSRMCLLARAIVLWRARTIFFSLIVYLYKQVYVLYDFWMVSWVNRVDFRKYNYYSCYFWWT